MSDDIKSLTQEEAIEKRRKVLLYSSPSTRRDELLEALEIHIKQKNVSTALIERSEIHCNDID